MPRTRLYSWLVVSMGLVVCVAGCGDDAPEAVDAATDTPTTDSAVPSVVEPPVPPELPSLTPCFEGFREVPNVDGPALCDAWPKGAPGTCASFEAHFPGRPGCERIGTTCPASGFPDVAAGAAVVYVLPGAVGGDGSAETPFGTLVDALAAAASGDTIALGVGTYEGELVVDRPVHLLGACPERTVLGSDSASLTEGVITVRSPGVIIENLQIADSARSAIWVEGTADATIRDVIIDGVTMIGIDAEQGAAVDVARVAIRDVARATLAPVAGVFGRGINVETRASATVDELVIDRAHEFGIFSFMGSTASITRAAITRVGPREDGTSGVGLMVLDGGALDARGVLVEDAHESAAAAIGVGSRITLEDVSLVDTRPQISTGIGGRGLNVQEAATGRCTRCLISDSPEVGILVGQGSEVELVDIVIRRGGSRPGATAGRGVEVQRGGVLSLSRCLVVDGLETALIVGGDGSTMTASDITVRRFDLLPDGTLGRALTVQNGASVDLTRASFEDVSDAGVLVLDGQLDVTDLTIRRVSPWRAGFFGRGVEVQSGVFRGSRIDIADTFDLGLSILVDSNVTLTDVRVARNLTTACADTTCPTSEAGHGVGVYDSNVDLERFVLDDHALCGVHVAANGSAVLRSGIVSNNEIGACVQSPEQEINALEQDVVYVDNVLSLESTTLPVPEPGMAL